jgi:hypothetical protein
VPPTYQDTLLIGDSVVRAQKFVGLPCWYDPISLFFYDLFNDVVSSSDYAAPNGTMIHENKLRMMRKEVMS